MALISVTEFAKKVGVNRQRIDQLIRAGKITVAKTKGNRRFIDLDQGKKEFAENRSDKPQGRPHKKDSAKTANEKKKFNGPVDETISLHEAERREKIYKAKIAELKYNEQAGLLVPRAQVEKEGFELGRKVRDNILNVPGRVAHELAAEVDPHKVEVQLMRELTQALEELAKGEQSE